MLEINININASELAQAITLLATNLGQAKSVNVVKSESSTKATTDSKPVTKPTQEEPTKEEKATTTESTLTVVEVRALVKKATKKDKAAVKNLLKEFGAESVTALDEKHYQAFYDKVEELL